MFTNCIFTILCLATASLNCLFAQSIKIPLRVSNNGTSVDTLRFGVDPSATSCMDAALGESELPPTPTSIVFDARFTDPRNRGDQCWGTGMDLDLRQYNDPAQIDTYRVKFQPGSAGYPMTFSWPNLNASYTGPVTLIDRYGGTDVNVDMLTQTNLVLTSTLVDELFIIAQGPRSVTAVDDERHNPWTFALHQNYPNPFNPTTTIRYDLPGNSHVILKLFNVLGQEVRTIVDEVQTPGIRSVEVDGKEFPSGVYYYEITAADFHDVKMLLLMK